jgi:hypothetical protein
MRIDRSSRASWNTRGFQPALFAHHRAEALHSAVLGMANLLSSQNGFPMLTAHIVHGPAPVGVLNKVRGRRADLLVVTRTAKTLVEDWLIPGVTSRLLDDGGADLLVVPA